MGDISQKRSNGIPVADYVAFDLETTGLSPETDEILEVAMVRFEGGMPVERWSSLVNPGIPVPLKTLRLTHIDPEELRLSPALPEILDVVQSFRRGLPLVGHNSGFDAAFLARHIPGFPGVPLYDTLELARIVVPGFSSYKLVDLAAAMGVPVSEAHRAYDDAEVSGIIFRLIQESAGRMSPQSREAVLHLMGPEWVAVSLLGPGPGVQRSLFDEPVQATPRQGLSGSPAADRVTPLALPQTREESIVCEMLAAGVGVRVMQTPQMPQTAGAIVRAAQRHALKGDKRVLLVNFPDEALGESVGLAGLPQDYVCIARLAEARRQAILGAYSSLDVDHRRFLASVHKWVEETPDGDLNRLQWGSAGYDVVPEISCPPNMACAATCPMRSQCFYLAARGCRGAGGSVAHATWAGAFAQSEAHDAVLTWDSHNLGRAWQLNESRVDLQELSEVLRHDCILSGVPSLESLIVCAGADLARGGVASPNTVAMASRVARELGSATSDLRQQRGAAEPGGYPVDPPILYGSLHVAEEAVGALDAFCEGAEGAVRVVEQSFGDTKERGTVLVRRAVWPAKAGVAALGGPRSTVLLFSDIVETAMESVGGRGFLGVGDDALVSSLAPDRPDDAAGGGLSFMVLDHGKMVSPAEYPSYLADFIVPAALVMRRGLLVLFPSKALLRDTYALVQPVLEARGIAVYGQNIDGGRRVVEHLADEDSLVFAIAGAGPAEGETVPHCLILTRVPFAPPNPLDETRRSQVVSSSGGFVEVGVRPAALALRSYVEKMKVAGGKRSVVVMDPKVLPRKSNWGADFIASFSDLPRFTCPAAEVLSRLGR